MEKLIKNKEDYIINTTINSSNYKNSIGDNSGSKNTKNTNKNRGCLPSSNSLESNLNFTKNNSTITDNEYEVTSEIDSSFKEIDNDNIDRGIEVF